LVGVFFAEACDFLVGVLFVGVSLEEPPEGALVVDFFFAMRRIESKLDIVGRG
jgi:hypothetical protein